MKKITKFFTISAIFMMLINMGMSQTVNVTFQVDMQEQTVAPEGVHITGSFQGWDPAATAMTLFIGDVYTYTYTGTAGEYIEYKFVNGDEWGEDEWIDGPCGINGNRFLTLPASDTILPALCYDECLPCILPQVNITFQVDMSNETVSIDGVHVAGTINGWDTDSIELTHIGNDIYAATIELGIGEYHEYKFLNGNAWGTDESVPPECATNNNRTFTVPDHDSTLVAVCFGSCDPCTTVTDINVTFRVDMSDTTVVAEGVHIAGSMQGWDPAGTLLTDLGNGIWEYSFTLQSGSYHEYKFVNGIAWGQDEIVPWYCNQNNNRYLTVPQNDTILPAVCYGSCLVCNPTPVDVTFQVDMSLQMVSDSGVHLAGTVQGWYPGGTEMTHVGSNVYEVTLTLGEGEFHEYKFINGNDWPGAENVPAPCANYDGNREFFVSSSDVTLDLVCFAECVPCEVPTYSFELQVWLEGPFNGTDMNTTLFDEGVLPDEQPYNTAPWNYDGTENIAFSPATDIVDWVMVELRSTDGDSSTATSDKMFHRFAALLFDNGTILDIDGSSLPEYTGPIFNNLYLVIYQRNHLPVMSATALVETAGIYVYDFTDDIAKAYGDGQKALGGGMYGMIGGDSDANGIVNMSDKDVNWTNDAGNAGYYGSDLNMDTQVNNPDKNDLWEQNLDEEAKLPGFVAFTCGDQISDIDGNTYNTVPIGSQCWMKENLKTTTYNNSTAIPNVNEFTAWGGLTTGAYVWYVGDISWKNKYGALYNWFATVDPNGLCPAGWHVPTNDELTDLTDYIGGTLSPHGNELKSCRQINSPLGGDCNTTEHPRWNESVYYWGTDDYGFSGLPGGFRNNTGGFGNIGFGGYWWSSTEYSSPNAWGFMLYYGNGEVDVTFIHERQGRSIRCLRD